VAKVRITAHNLNTGADHTALSGSDGAFTVSGLEPGQYQVAAAKDGFLTSTTNVEVAAPETAAVDFLLTADTPPAPAAKAAPSASEIADELDALKKRIGELEAALETRSAPAETAKAPAPAPAPAAQTAPASAPQTAPAPAAPSVPDALQPPDPSPAVDNVTPFAYGDFTWLNGTPRNKDTVLDTKFLTPEVRFDTNYMADFNQPKDHTIVGATE